MFVKMEVDMLLLMWHKPTFPFNEPFIWIINLFSYYKGQSWCAEVDCWNVFFSSHVTGKEKHLKIGTMYRIAQDIMRRTAGTLRPVQERLSKLNKATFGRHLLLTNISVSVSLSAVGDSLQQRSVLSHEILTILEKFNVIMKDSINW